MSKTFTDAVKNRRSIYGIGKETLVSDARIEEIVEFAVTNSPSAFNSQSGRVVILLNAEHDALWDITTEALREISSKEDFSATEQKMGAFKNGYGTILFFEDEAVVKGLQESFPSYQEKFPDYSLQSSGMLQFVVWTALEAEGYGASLQHYNPIIDDEVKAKWNLPKSWNLISQMPFGNVLQAAGEKEVSSLEERIKVFK